MRTSKILLALAAMVAVPAVAVAEPAPVVLAVNGAEVYVDVGGQDGVGAGAELELLHYVAAKDPTTGRVLRDKFVFGTLVVERAGDHVALARAEEALVGRIAPGDEIRLVGDAQVYRDPWAARVAASKAPGPVAPGASRARTPGAVAANPARERLDAEAVRAAWQSTLGRSLEDRIARWQEFLAGHADSDYAPVIRLEIKSLDTQRRAREAAIARAGDVDHRYDRIRALSSALAPGPDPLAVDAPGRVTPGQPIALAFLVRDPDRVGAPALYARQAGDKGYRRFDLRRDGDAYLRADVPAELVGGSSVEWFVETTDRAGGAVPLIASRQAPSSIAVDRGLDEPPIAEKRSRIRLAGDYVDFDGGLGRGHDQYMQAELDFMYRFIKPLYAFRLGFGTMAGKGGPKDVIDEDPTDECLDENGVYRCRRVNFNYVYVELEHRFKPNFAVMIRPQAGLVAIDARPDDSNSTRCARSQDIAQCSFEAGFGARGRVRFGEETGTNLVLGVGFTSGVGTLLEATYQWFPTRVVPVELSVQVTDQPVPEDFGVRLIADVGWRGTRWFYPSARLSYQARDIDHSGVSGGVAMNFDW
jgi:hypothetical protein